MSVIRFRFSAVSYLFEDSQAGLRTRDSLGNNVVTSADGMVWTQAGIREPVVAPGPFIMNDRAQIDDAITRHRAGACRPIDIYSAVR